MQSESIGGGGYFMVSVWQLLLSIRPPSLVNWSLGVLSDRTLGTASIHFRLVADDIFSGHIFFVMSVAPKVFML